MTYFNILILGIFTHFSSWTVLFSRFLDAVLWDREKNICYLAWCLTPKKVCGTNYSQCCSLSDFGCTLLKWVSSGPWVCCSLWQQPGQKNNINYTLTFLKHISWEVCSRLLLATIWPYHLRTQLYGQAEMCEVAEGGVFRAWLFSSCSARV